MLEPNESEISADIVEDACKSDYFSDDGEAKNDSLIVENSKRKPEEAGLDETKKLKISVEESSSKVNSLSQHDPSPASEFIRAGSVTSDNSDEFVDASDVLVEPTPSQEKKSRTPTDSVDSCAVKNIVTNDTFKSNIFEPEAPKLKDNKFLKRLPTFADDPLERFNSSAIRRGFMKESESIKPIDFNFDFNPNDKGENKTIKKVKLNRSKFATAERPKFSDDSSSDSNSRFNVSSTSPVKSDLLSVENKERNFKSVNLIKPAITEKTSPLKNTPSTTVSSTVPAISAAPVPAPTVNASVSEVSVSTPIITITPPAVSVAAPSVNIASIDKDSTSATSATIPPSNLPAPVVNVNVSAPIQTTVLNTSPEPETSSISTKDENPVPEIENIVPESSSDAFIDEDDTTDENHSSPQTVISKVVELSDEKIVETNEISFSEIYDESVEELNEIEHKIDESEPQLNENLSQNVLEDLSENLQDIPPAEVTYDTIQMSIDLSQDIEMSPIADEVSQKPNDDVPQEFKKVSQTTVSKPEHFETQQISEGSEMEEESFENDSEPIPETNATIIEPKPSPVLEPTPVKESISVIDEPEKTISESDPELETFALNMEPESVHNDEPEPPSEKSDKIDEIDLTSDIEDLTEEKIEHESSNEESEGEIEEEEEDEEEIIHEEEVYLDDRTPDMIKSRGKSPLSIPTTSQPRVENHEVMEIDDDEPVQIIPEPSKTIKPREPLRPHRTSSIENIEDIPMEIDESVLVSQSRKCKELSKLEQALIGKPLKKLEIQIPVAKDELFNVTDESSTERSENEETKEKIKLHLSLQGDKISIKKGPLDTSTGEVRVKRQYRKRRLESIETDKSGDKTYKLRNRTIKKDEEDLTQTPDQNHGNVEVNMNKRPNECTETKTPEKYSAEPVTIDLENIDSQPTAKVQPIKLKISKNSNITIECGEKSRTENSEESRKKDTIPNYMEKAATAWSGPDLQRVERLLKESNITITPVMSKEAAPQTPQPVIRQVINVPKDKPAVISPAFSTPSVSATVSFQTNTASITPIVNNKHEDSSADETPSSPCDQTENGDTTIDLDSSARSDDSDTPSSSIKQVDVKFEIRKKLASAEKRKQESRDSNDSESELSDSKSKSKVPDLLPLNFPTPEMLQNLANSLNSSTSNGEAADGKKEIDPAFLPLLQTLPKKRGRPTKAMVAAREALKQSQEVALESLRQYATQKGAEGEDIMAHFPIPLFDMTDSDSPHKAKRGRKPKGDRNDKSDGDQSAMEDPVLDPIREAEEIKRLEEERIRKEEERERKNEIRRQKAKERNDLVKAKRLRQKMKAEERQKRMQEKRRQLQEEKKKLEEEIKNLPSTLTGFDDETRMSAENSQMQSMSFSMAGMGEDDSSNATTELSQRVKKSRMEVTDADSKDLTVDQIAEYQWPIQGGELYMIQEQVSNFLGVKSFKRKYPDIKRRPVDSEERAYLVDSGLVSETLCDLGLTAVCSAEVLDIMCADFPDKYEELRRHMREKQMKELSFKQKAWANGLGYKLLMADGTKQDLKKRAMESASNWNLALNKSRGEDRRCAMDLQTFIVHYPKNRTQKMIISTAKIGSYPVSILPGQFCDYYKPYTSTELRYMPVNTVLYGPLKPHAVNHAVDGSQTDSDDSSSSDESSTTSEGTQATEDTIEDTDKDMSVDESSQLGKSSDLSLLKDQMTMELSENTRELIMDEAAKILCKVCLGNMARNKENIPEVLICCSQCSSTSHPTCLDLSLDMVPHIKKYAWQCPDCKICARCKENADEDKMLFCDTCDRGYHIYCVGLKKVPSGRWQCQECITNVEHTIYNSTVRETFKEPGLIEITDG